MSLVTNVILSFSIIEEEEEENTNIYILEHSINNWLKEQHHLPFVGNLWQYRKAIGGDKNLETPVYVGSFNYLDQEAFIAFVFSLDWLEPENVQVMMQEQEDDKFTVYGAPSQSPE